jgi:GNAT superfamily N-acetyltransferase
VSSLSTRRATVDDAHLLSAFARRVFFETFAADNDPADMAMYLEDAFTESKQRGELADPARVCLLVEHKGVLVAYASVFNGSGNEHVTGAHPVELERFYVDRAWHGRGVAAPLMAAVRAVAAAWGGDALWLGVWERNAKAIRFYEKQGFARVGAQTFRLGSDEQQDAVMRAPLGAA